VHATLLQRGEIRNGGAPGTNIVKGKEKKGLYLMSSLLSRRGRRDLSKREGDLSRREGRDLSRREGTDKCFLASGVRGF
jgi:hypothetical protein